ncbi:hypothetical protein M878_07530 [Streptomyces roseochromogenus subsp. oscitans DS 12.976]|uniref:Uncharacterized protein n=1 Tax=Streptomyces roseochromogenus subsp. oscitans DS 12.976 TaxID=1352936 RepID=V6KSG1_STRRC|nr:hypothetical protein M878_07530 [Streptomyces roseochromogenus subsp. oscitans DS 12.976]
MVTGARVHVLAVAEHASRRVPILREYEHLDASVAFCSKLFGTEPSKLRDGCANFAITEPPAQARHDRRHGR